MTQKRMFPFITNTKCNVIGGRCPHDCVYCWSKVLVNRYRMKKYLVEIYWDNNVEFDFKQDDFVFVQDMTDLFAEVVPWEFIDKMIRICMRNPNVKFLMLTKNPRRYFDVLRFLERTDYIPTNIIWGATIESNYDYPRYSKAPSQRSRLLQMQRISQAFPEAKLFISIEPILDFDIDDFSFLIQSIRPWAIAVGYDNYGNSLTEPLESDTRKLIDSLRSFTTVYEKTIRKSWNEI